MSLFLSSLPWFFCCFLHSSSYFLASLVVFCQQYYFTLCPSMSLSFSLSLIHCEILIFSPKFINLFQGVATQIGAIVSVMLAYFFTFRSGDLIWCWKFKIFLYCQVLNISLKHVNQFEKYQLNKMFSKTLTKYCNDYFLNKKWLVNGVQMFWKWNILHKFWHNNITKKFKN
jgi:hypothetical protein